MKVLQLPGTADINKDAIEHLAKEHAAGNLKSMIVCYIDKNGVATMTCTASMMEAVWMHKMQEGWIDRCLDPEGHGM